MIFNAYFQFNNQKNLQKWGSVFKDSLYLICFYLFFSTTAHAFDFVSSKGEKKVSTNKELFISQSSNRQNIRQKNKSRLVHRCFKKNKFQEVITKESLLNNVNKKLITAIISAESCFNPMAVSPKGAQGLMQLMPFTAKRFGVKNSFNPSQNISGGVKYLRFLIKRFRGDSRLAIAAYNAGEGAVDHYGGVPPYKETRQYVKKIMKLLGDNSEAGLFLSNDSGMDKKKIKTSKCHSNSRLRNHSFAVYGSKFVKRYYLLGKNESLLQVARKVNISLDKIIKINNLSITEPLYFKVQNLLLSECKIA